MIQFLEIFGDVTGGITPRALRNGRPPAGRLQRSGIPFVARDPEAEKEASD